MPLNLNQTISANDLARALDGDQGTFVARQGGQNFLVTAAQGHSIVSGPTPMGPPVAGYIQTSGNADPWYITKISNAEVSQQDSRSASGSR